MRKINLIIYIYKTVKFKFSLMNLALFIFLAVVSLVIFLIFLYNKYNKPLSSSSSPSSLQSKSKKEPNKKREDEPIVTNKNNNIKIKGGSSQNEKKGEENIDESFKNIIKNKLKEMMLIDNQEIVDKEFTLLDNKNYKIILSYKLGNYNFSQKTRNLKEENLYAYIVPIKNILNIKAKMTDTILNIFNEYIEKLKIKSNIIKKEQYTILDNTIKEFCSINGILEISFDLEKNEINYSFQFTFQKENTKLYANLELKIIFKDKNDIYNIIEIITSLIKSINFKNKINEIIIIYITILVILLITLIFVDEDKKENILEKDLREELKKLEELQKIEEKQIRKGEEIREEVKINKYDFQNIDLFLKKNN